MGKYQIALTDRAKIHLSEWKKSGQHIALKKIQRIVHELSLTPYSGIGSPEPLKFNFSGLWSRKIDNKNRIIYQVSEESEVVYVVSVKGHYDDK